MNDGEYEDIVSYAEILDQISWDDTDHATYWKFERIIGHQGPLKTTDVDYKGSRYNVLIEWSNGETTFKPLSIIGKDAPIPCAIYAKEKGLLDEEGWRRFKPLAKREKKLFHMANQVKLRSFRTTKVYKYGFEVPHNHADAMHLDKKNQNTRWQDAEATKLGQLDKYNAFDDHGPGGTVPRDYKKIHMHMVYDVKHDGCHKA